MGSFELGTAFELRHNFHLRLGVGSCAERLASTSPENLQFLDASASSLNGRDRVRGTTGTDAAGGEATLVRNTAGKVHR